MQEHTAIPFPLPQLTAADSLTDVLLARKVMEGHAISDKTCRCSERF